MTISIGTDIVEISRFTPEYASIHFLKKSFTQYEINAYNSSPTQLAVSFALKESLMKALGQGIQQGLWFTQIQIHLYSPQHSPTFDLTGPTLTRYREIAPKYILSSCASSKTLALAFVLLER